MELIKKGEIIPHKVLVDTTILWFRDKTEIINPEFENFWRDSNSEMNLQLVVPEVVKGELEFQHTTSAIKSMQKAKNLIERISEITHNKYSLKLTHSAIRKQVKTKFNGYFKRLKAEIVPTPIERIQWKSLIDKAIWREGCFLYDPKNPNNEKGFRDSLILETVLDYCKREENDVKIAFLSIDKILRESIEESLSHDRRFTSFESIDRFNSYLNLMKERLEHDFIMNLTKFAAKTFYQKGNAECLFEKNNVIREIRDRFDHILNSSLDLLFKDEIPVTSSANGEWLPIEEGRFFIDEPLFEKREYGDSVGDIYSWLSIVRYLKIFRKCYAPIFSEGVRLGDKYEDEKALLLTFHITWIGKLTKSFKFLNSKVNNIEFIDKSFDRLTYKQRMGFDLL